MINKNHVEALVELTRRRTKQELDDSLVASLTRIASATGVQLYELYNDNNDREFSATNAHTALVRPAGATDTAGEAIDSFPGFTQCIAAHRIIRDFNADGSTARIVFPVRGLRDAIGLLVVDCEPCRGEIMYLIEALAQVWDSQRYLMELNERDRLTGLLNRQAYDNLMPMVFSDLRVEPEAPGLTVGLRCLAIMDIDKFKEVNDQLGHLYGDEVLVQFARILNRSFRFNDHTFRFGGEEFVVILNHVDLPQALAIAERFRHAVEQYHFPGVGTKTVSIGLVQLRPNELPTTLIDKADKALYYAKQNGRNQTQVYEWLVEQGKLPAQNPYGDVELF